MVVVAGIADEPSLEEGDIEDGGVKVDELEDEDFEDKLILKLRLCAMHFWKKR